MSFLCYKFGQSELFQETNVVFIKQSHVVDAVFTHSNALNTDSEGKTAVNFGIYAAAGEHVGVNHTCSEHFDPALTLAQTAALASAHKARKVNFNRRLGEREVMGAEAGFCALSEHGARKLVERSLQVSESDMLVYYQAFKLMEHRRMSGVCGVTAVNSAGRDDTDRRTARLHSSDLDGRGLRSEHYIVT